MAQDESVSLHHHHGLGALDALPGLFLDSLDESLDFRQFSEKPIPP